MPNSISTLTIRAVRYLASVDLPSTLNQEILDGLIKNLPSQEILDPSRVTLTFDLIAEDESTWTIAASTDPKLVSPHSYSTKDGLTGWVLRTRRSSPLHLTNSRSFPPGLKVLEPIQGIQSAFVYVLRTRNRAIGALCAISREEGIVNDDLARDLHRVGLLLEIVFEDSHQSPRMRRYGSSTPPPSIVADKAHIVRWLRSSIDEAGFDWADYWSWNAEEQHLVPHPVSRQLCDQQLDWLRPLRLGEGFVGQAAYTRKSIDESLILEGEGQYTGIKTPLPEIVPRVPLRSILAIPVCDAHQLHGVISILGETPDQFDERAKKSVIEIAEKAAYPLKEIAERKLATAHSNIKKELFDALEDVDSPNQYWKRLSKVLKVIESHRLGLSAYFWVARRSDRKILTCKATSPTARDSLGRVYDTRNEKLLAYLKSREHGAFRVDSIKKFNLEAYQQLKSMRVSKIWLDRYPRTNGDPLFFAAVTLPDRTHYTEGFGTRSLDQLLDPIFAAIFATSRAVINAADASSLAKERERIMTTGAHELRSPLSSTRSKLQAMALGDLKSEGYRTEALGDIDLLLLRIENMLYGYKKDASSRELLRVSEVCKIAIRRLQTAEREAQISLSLGRIVDDSETRVHGARHWLLVALLNVIHNAVKFGKKSAVRINIRKIEEDSSQGWVEVEIRDHGIGIPQSELKKIFLPGHRNPHSRKFDVRGSQIGLAITKEIVEEHGGKIWATSSIPNSRTSFILRIPAAATPEK